MDASLLLEFKRKFEQESGLIGVDFEIKSRSDGPLLILRVSNPTERLFRVLESVRQSLINNEGSDVPRATLERRAKDNPLKTAEGRLLLRTLSESLNINRNSFKEDFFARYTKSVSGAEEQITAAANHLVFGRRGAGKSSLLLFGLHSRSMVERVSAWVDMQVYAQRKDIGVAVDILAYVIEQVRPFVAASSAVDAVAARLERLKESDTLSETDIRKVLPDVRKALGEFSGRGQDLAIFLDDYHVIDAALQPKVLAVLYAVTRGNGIYLKISSIETLTQSWDPTAKAGLQIPHDVQEIKLDYNLTIPEKATEHITSILDAHAVYCGLSSIRSLCTSTDVLSRLVWVAAGVPRDALSIFAQAMTKASLADGKRVSVSSINVAASETVNVKLKELDTDASGEAQPLHDLLEELREFCIKKQRKNAFLTEIRSDDLTYQRVLKLVDLRLLHVINEGISVGEAGRKYLALILDYGFYIGIRAAKSVDLFNKQTKKVAYRDLRRLPVFDQLQEAGL
jgi:rRNA maturation endonuclease Nob1